MIKKMMKQNIKENKKNYCIIIIASTITIILMSIIAPFLVKKIIDDNILVDSRWVVTTKSTNNVSFNNQYYKRLSSNSSKDYVILKKEKERFYFANKPINNKDAYKFLDNIFKDTIITMGLFFLSYIIVALLAFIADYYLRIIARKTIKQFREKSINVLLKLPIDYFDTNSDGETITKIVNDTETFHRLIIDVGTVVINSTIVYLSITIVMLFINIYLFFIALLILPMTIIWMRLYIKKVISSFELQRDSLSQMNSLINEQIHGLDLIKTYQYEQRAEILFEKQTKKFYDNSRIALITEGIIGWTLVDFLRGLFSLLIIIYFGLAYLNSSSIMISAGFIFLIIQFMNSITHPLIELIHMLNAFNTVNVSLSRLDNYLNQPIESDNNNELVISNGDISFNNVSFAYKDQLVLKNISLNFKTNKKNALVGSTGSGKSTIISLLMRFYDYKEGHITIDGKDIMMYSRQSLRSNIGLVLQKTYLFEGTIYDNIVMDSNYSKEDVIELAKIAHADFIYNKGLDKIISETSNNLSVGQKQIVALLRALIKQPKILILDEASSNLDMESEQAINNLIDYYSKSTTIIIIAHRIATIANCDHIFVINNGYLIEEGKHEQLLKNESSYYDNIKSLNI